MDKPLIWIIDEEWPDYELEKKILTEKYPGCDIRFSTYDYAADLESFGKNADAVICQVYAPMPAETINKLEKCRIIAVYGGGYDRVDTKAAKAKDIYVTNVSGYCAEDLSDYVMAAIFAFNKHFVGAEEAIKAGKWGAGAVFDKGKRLNVSTLMIVGCGTIGSLVAKKAIAHGLKVIAYDPYVSREALAEKGVSKVDTLEEGFEQADYISVNAILTPETTGLIRYEHFLKMKPSVCIVNTARGKVFVEEDMIRAKEDGLFKGAMLDVISAEPPTYDEPIFDCKGIMVTPHISYISQDSFDELKRRASNNVITVLEGSEPRDWVNK
ncbi:MAG: C-terminal binding protein [Huintestinicola sp.]